MLQKPEWLATALGYLNWDIFTWHVYVGDTAENAIDWVLDGINTLITWAQQVGAWWEEFRQEVLDIFNLIPQWINEVWDYVLNLVDATRSIIATWWEATFEIVKEWVRALVDTVKDAVTVVNNALTWLTLQWDNFTTSILPTLASRFDVREIVQTILTPLLSIFNFLESVKGDLIDFFNDPVEYIWQRFSDWFFGGE